MQEKHKNLKEAERERDGVYVCMCLIMTLLVRLELVGGRFGLEKSHSFHRDKRVEIILSLNATALEAA